MLPKDAVEIFSEFLREYYFDEIVSATQQGKKAIEVDFSLLEKFNIDAADYLLDSPDEALELLKESVKKIDSEIELKVRIFNLPESRNIRIRALRAEHLGKLLAVDGIVKRASEVRPEVEEAVFSCPKCGNKISVVQVERTIRRPVECDCGNRGGFRLVDQRLFDARWVTIEEPYEIVSGERPSEIMVYLKDDLTSPKMQTKTDPGNRIRVVGILKSLPRRIKGTRSRQMEIYIDANWVEALEIEWEELEITPEDEKKIWELAKDPEIYKKLVASLAPTIYGHEEVKEALILQMFGGNERLLEDRTRIRGDIHCLIIGDPATSKSQLMKLITTLIPRGKYVAGRSATAAGLIATVTRDEEFLGGWVLEAGAVIMANKSVCAIDEFEKLDKDDQIALHECMEQGSCSVAKASIVATLPARTAILAGGNPKLGRFDPYLPIREQVDIPETLLSRFDLRFAIRDIPNAEQDQKMAEHIFSTRHFGGSEAKPLIPPEFLRKYVAYARKNCHPELTKEAAKAIESFYLELRKKSEEGPIAITPRQLEAVIRLAEASAKVRLSQEVTVEDAERAINLMKVSLRQLGFEPGTGMLDIDRAEGQRLTSAQRGKIRIMHDIIEELTLTLGKQIPVDEVIKKAKEAGIDNVEEILRKMLNEGICFSPKPGIIEKIGSL